MVTKARILHIETATTVCSVALAEDGELRVLKSVNDGFKHAENLMRLIREAMEEMNWQYSELAAIAVSAGPGSYTGLRIGVSAAKGLCYATSAPLIAVSTLYTLAAGFRRLFPEADTHICPMIDARRMEVYTAVFNRDLHTIRPDHPLVLESITSIPELVDHEITFLGDGAEKSKAVLAEHPNAYFADDIQLSAQDMIGAAFEAYQLGSFADLAYFEPEYLKPYQGTMPVPKALF